ncbi:uncharacterized protein MONOS_5875 [Monocercomonoides exilis]|uniref:uncharacterized protein n=1 Tax=Monocercomonoides exilis TaxID=2049356 RepID=UPI00355A045F|nr:hypothetical protein MONOS_5875 [Monocercomonoides exilis]|eukprot:MONOS_5875.1-p1 / transcript=MONOS_5875.1 / gene=MONOS_5875 / organism=Monocercomonoides_exilis_PA203 / gene_product=putative uncharacterized protein / transcript_product=putative uncharacterized protein / location=Mono_scaffold00176:95575-97995(+) / protein_length=806 / sequence_SO=supercontig / SO=protein_coding / is_pseudo=false
MNFTQMSSIAHEINLHLPLRIADNTISCIQKTFSFLTPNDQKKIQEIADLIMEEIGQGLITDKLIQQIDCYEEFIDENLRINDETTNNQSVKELKDCFNEIRKIQILYDYPQDINKLQRISLELKRPKDLSGGVEDCETNSSFWETADDYIPCVEEEIDGRELYYGLNDSLAPMMQLLQKLLDKSIRYLETDENIRNAYVDRIRKRSEESCDNFIKACKRSFRIPYRKIIPEFNPIWTCYIPFYQFKAIRENKKLIENFDKKFKKYEDVALQSEMLACSISLLRKAIEDYGCECGYDKPMCIFRFYKKENFITVSKVDSNSLLHDIIKNADSIVCSSVSLESKLTTLQECIKKVETELSPTIRYPVINGVFCLFINRISHILEGYENYRQGKTMEELKAMSNLRKDINRCVIEYKIKYVSQTEPILGVEIHQCKVVADNPFRKMIFLEKTDALHFRQNVNEAFDKKAENISRTYPDEKISSQEIREIAEKLNPDSYKDMVEKLQKEQNKMESDAEKMEAFAEEYFSKLVLSQINLVGSIAKFGAECVEWGIHEAKEFLVLKADWQRILASRPGVPTAGVKPNGLLTVIGSSLTQLIERKIQSWIGTKKRNVADKKDNPAKNEGTNEKGGEKKEASKKEEADKKVDITKKEEADKKEDTSKKEEADKKEENSKKDESDKKEETDKKEIILQSKANDIKKEFPELNLSPQYIEEFAKGCEYMINADEIRKNIIIVSNQKEYWKRVQCYEQDFINLLKLSIQLKWAKLDEMNFQGILVDEKKAVRRNDKSGANLARFNEYSVKKLNCIE